MRKVVTVGAYGFDETAFFKALQDAGVDTFCDIRLRRGMRGSKYSFANSRHLQMRLQAMGIRYLHVKQLAPPQNVRQLQHDDDAQKGTGKRNRAALGANFIEAYEHNCLSNLDTGEFLSSVIPSAGVVAFFCVESEPEACHRSLVSARLAKDLEVEVQHIKP